MIPLQHGLILAAILFVLGLTGLVIRRNLLFMLIGLEIMINASALAFVVAGHVAEELLLISCWPRMERQEERT